jgi:hypothetical protein
VGQHSLAHCHTGKVSERKERGGEEERERKRRKRRGYKSKMHAGCMG